MDEQDSQDQPGDGDTEVQDTSQTDTTQADGGSGDGTQVSDTTQQPAPPKERLFTQAEVNAFLAEERRKAQRATLARPVVQTPPSRETPGGTVTPRPFDEETKAALREYIDPLLQPYEQARVAGEIERATISIKAQHPELAEKAADGSFPNMDAVLQIVLSWGEDFINRTPTAWLLEQGYAAWQVNKLNDPAYKQKIVDTYLADKAKQARKTPPPQGGGGRATTSKTDSKGKNSKDWGPADQAMKELIREAEAAG